MSQLYQATNSDDLIKHDLEGMTLIYQKASGITHVVADPVPGILEVMGESKASVSAIVSKLSEKFDLEQDVDAEEVVLARLEELCALGLVERVTD